jgi:hypothetical protein
MVFVLDFIVHYLLKVRQANFLFWTAIAIWKKEASLPHPVRTTCFGPDRWPSSGNMYIKYTKVTTVYVNGSVESAV